MGADVEYTGGDMVTVHTGRNITEEQFNEVARMLQETLQEMNVG